MLKGTIISCQMNTFTLMSCLAKVIRGEAVTIPSFGYEIQDGKYVPDSETAPILKQIFSDYLNGVGMRTIAIRLNDNGYRTRRGNRFENRTIKYILQNPVYIGKIRWTPTKKLKRGEKKPRYIDY